MSSKCRNCLPFAEIARNAQIDYLKKISANDYLKSECASTLIQMKNQTKATLTKQLFFPECFLPVKNVIQIYSIMNFDGKKLVQNRQAKIS